MTARKKYLYSLISVTWILMVSICHGQTPFLKEIPLFQGREDYKVNVVYQDPLGWMWFGTDKGLFRYDGINLDHFTQTDSLADDNITVLHNDGNGMMWIGHKNGKITRYDQHQFEIFRPEEGLGRVEITDIVTDQKGDIWYSTLGEGIFRYNGRYLSNVNSDDGLSDDYVYDIELDTTGAVWLATDYGITCFKDDSADIISMKDGLPDNIVRVIKTGSDGILWVGSEEKGISTYDPDDGTITQIEGWNYGPITGFAMNLKNELWVSTSNEGIVKVLLGEGPGAASYQQITAEQGLVSDRLNGIIRDRENNIWIACRRGVTQALPPVFEFLNQQTGTPFEMVYSFTLDLKGNYWVCSETGLFNGIKDQNSSLEWVNVSEVTGLGNQNFISIYLDPLGSIWTGTYGSGVFRIDPEDYGYSNFTTRDGLNDNNVIHIAGNEQGTWFSTLGGGVSVYNYATSRIESYEDEHLNESYVYATFPVPGGETWIAGSLPSPALIKNDSVSYMDHLDYDFPQLYGIAIDSAGHTWFNTNSRGILCMMKDTILHFGETEGIEFEEIQSIIFDKWDNLVIISNEGIKFFNTRRGIVKNFGENTGLSYRYPVLNAVYTDKNDQVWIGTETGIIKYNPDYLDKISDTPRIFLSTVNLFGQPVTRKKSVYRHNENNFTFGYTGIWFNNPEGLSYRYKLEGYDLDWTYSRRNQPFTYSKLPPGEYTFVAQVSLDNNQWSDSEASVFAFTVKPPFWKRAWFIVLMVLLMISGVLLYIRLRLANLRKARDELEKEVDRRTEEIRTQNEELESQKEEIEAQRDLAEEQRDQIEHQNEEIQASIRYAFRIQTAALPPKSYLNDILGDHFVLNKPRDIVSGDFYWVARRDNHLFFAVGDCTGHGVPGAFMSMLGLTALNDIVKSLDICQAGEILDRLASRIRDSLHQGSADGNTSKDGMDISLCIYEPDTRKLQFAAAHNSLYIINNGELRIVEADNIGIDSYVDESFNFTNHELNLKNDDVLYLFTDGFPDQFGGPKGKKYKYKRFREFLVKIHGETMMRQKWLLDEEIESWKIGHPQLDDIMVMGVKP